MAVLACLRENLLSKWRESSPGTDSGHCSFLLALLLPFQGETLSMKSEDGVLALTLLAQGLLSVVHFTQSLVASLLLQDKSSERKPLQGLKPATYL